MPYMLKLHYYYYYYYYNIVTARIDALVISGSKFVHAFVKEVCRL
jgi:hypothetical protein